MPESEVARLCALRADSVSSVGLPDAGGEGGPGWDMVDWKTLLIGAEGNDVTDWESGTLRGSLDDL